MNENIGHAKRIRKYVTVKKRGPRKAWTNRTTTLVQKFCKKHNKICEFSGQRCKLTRQEDYKKSKNNNPTEDNITCRKCKECQSCDNFYKSPQNKNGRSTLCKTCKRGNDKQRNDTWPVLIRAAYRQSINAHGNEKGENEISVKECEELLKKQKYFCNHCRNKLTCHQGTVINCNYTRASLDRIDTKKIGYKNNAQWLCVSCNKGKCTMPNEEHKRKFSILFDKIEYLEKILKENNIQY